MTKNKKEVNDKEFEEWLDWVMTFYDEKLPSLVLYTNSIPKEKNKNE